ncbi:MAG: hypothetical protein EOP61_35560 [Sphingomonadales bacterium]|nr:MAG: hypothetical protein EOP61_35560 [Sphingomonadales bacterium]
MLGFILLLAGAAQAPASAPPTSYGAGTANCATAWARDNAPISFVWTQGFWSALNASSGSGGSVADFSVIIERVRLDCTENPSQTLAQSVANTHRRMR